MVALNVVQRLRQHTDLRAYRRKLATEIGHHPLMRLLPALLGLPLEFADQEGALCRLDDAVARAAYVSLGGAPGAGRHLALQQQALRWTSTDSAPVPAMVVLPRLDDGATPPDALLLRWLSGAGGPGQSGPPMPRSASGMSLDTRLAGWALLVSGLDELPEPRRDAWRALLQAAPQGWPEARLVVAAPRGDQPWPGFLHLEARPPSPSLLAEWVGRLAPQELRGELLRALGPAGPLEPFAERLWEVVLLALVAPRGGLPGSRAELYDRAIAVLFGLERGAPAAAQALVSLQLLAAYDERPPALVEGLVEPTGDGGLRFTHQLLRGYLAARQLVAEERYDLLAALEPGQRAELARFAATSAAPAPVYAALWGGGHPTTDDLLALGKCLRERPDSPPAWTLRVVGALALLARDGRAAQRERAAALLGGLTPALAAALHLLVRAGEQAQRAVLQVLHLLPPELAAPHAERYAFHAATDAPLAWDLADLLISRPGGGHATPAAPADQAALARWVYVQALGSSERRARLFEAGDTSMLRALASPSIGSARLLRVAAVLIDDPALPASVRIAGLELLADNEQPTALTVIERACYDENAAIRQAALAVLASRDPSRGLTALSRAALDRAAPIDTRVGAIERLSIAFAAEGQLLLARTARDLTLPLYSRLLSVAALGASSGEALAEISRDADDHPVVRGMAAERLGASDGARFSLMSSMLERDDLPTALLEGVCAGLGALGQPASVDPLLWLLARSPADVDATLAAVQALGQLRLETAVGPLSELLVSAPDRLASAVPGMLDHPVDVALEEQTLPAPFALRLQTTLARSATIADRPTTLREFIRYEADQVRVAAAHALAAIGGNSARAALLAALIDGDLGSAAGDVVAALAQIGTTGNAESLGYLLTDPEVNPVVRWLSVQLLRDHAEGEPVLRRAFAQPELDPFVRGALAEALGQRGALTAMPLLRQIAENRQDDAHLRAQAIIGLGLLNESSTEVVLIRLTGDASEDPELRGLAAEQLPARISDEGRRFLREMLRRERLPAPVSAGVLRALGRAQDREALPLLLRYCQEEHATIAIAALDGIAELRDGSVAPVLVRVAQNPNIDQATRLHAVGTLLRIGGVEYRPLLRAYLEDGPLPLRLQALEHLIATPVSASELLGLLADRDWPLPMRLRLLAASADDPAAPATHQQLLASTADPQLRRLAAISLGQRRHAASVAALASSAASAPAQVRLACVEALEAISTTEACMALGALVESHAQPHILRHWASQSLRRAVKRLTAA